MRLFVATALSLFATPALACGMYIPEEMLIADIGELMDDVDSGPIEGFGTVVAGADVAEINAIEAAAANDALLDALVAEVPLTQAVVVQQAETTPAQAPVSQAVEVVETDRKLTRKERRAMKRRARSAGV